MHLSFYRQVDQLKSEHAATLAAALESQEARIVAQIRGELGWAPAVVRRQKGEMRAIRETLTKCEGRAFVPEDADQCCSCDDLARMDAWLADCEIARGEAMTAERRYVHDSYPEPCSPGEVQIRGGCAVEVIETTETGHQMGAMLWDAQVKGDGWEASRGPELVPDVTFKLARDKGKAWSLLGHFGADRKSEATVFDGVAGVNSPEHLTLTQNRYSLAAGATLVRTKHGLTVIGRANGDGIDGATAMWTIKLAGD